MVPENPLCSVRILAPEKLPLARSGHQRGYSFKLSIGWCYLLQSWICGLPLPSDTLWCGSSYLLLRSPSEVIQHILVVRVITKVLLNQFFFVEWVVHYLQIRCYLSKNKKDVQGDRMRSSSPLPLRSRCVFLVLARLQVSFGMGWRLFNKGVLVSSKILLDGILLEA